MIATGFNAEGMTFQHGADMLMANDEATFLHACLLLARDGSLSRRLAARAGRGGTVRLQIDGRTWSFWSLVAVTRV